MLFGRSSSPARSPLWIGVFLKHPSPGAVKTRLGRDIGPRASCDLYRCPVADTLECVLEAPEAHPVVFFSPASERAGCAKLLPKAAPVDLVAQSPGTLGTRMYRAFVELFRRGAERAALIGTDCPLLDRETLAHADHALRSSDVVLGPANDGGYYLIGLRRPLPGLFRSIPWSTAAVLDSTLEQAHRLGLETTLLDELSDVDDFDDLLRLERDLLQLWERVRHGEREHFPLHTFRWVSWRPDRPAWSPRRPKSRPSRT